MTDKEKLEKAYSGLLGQEIVVKKGRKGQNVIALASARPKSEPTEKQLKWAQNMRKASQYAKNALAIPELLALYTKHSRKNYPAYRVAVNDFLQKPVIDTIDHSGYRGNVDDTVIVSATDKIAITGVSVKLTAPDGTLIESGACVQDLPTSNYIYTATCQVDVIAGTVICITVTDIPGNKVEKAITL